MVSLRTVSPPLHVRGRLQTLSVRADLSLLGMWEVKVYEKVDMALREFDLVAVQEISRSEKVGWDERETDSFFLVLAS